MSAVVPTLSASRDPETGQVYFPPRRVAADGSGRACEPVEIVGAGLLRGWTSSAGEQYGLIDLEGGLRLQARLAGSEHEYGARYVVVDAEEVRFSRA